jgi:hypothetical protein
MARMIFGGGPEDVFLITDADGDLQQGRGAAVLFYSTETGANPIIDLLDINSSPIASVTTSTGADGRAPGQIAPFFGPDGVYEMWASAAGSPRFLLQASNLGGVLGPRTDAYLVHAAQANGHGTGLDNLTDVSAASVNAATNGQALVYNATAGLWSAGTVAAGGGPDATKVDKGTMVLNVRDYGALGNGTDCSAALLAAVAAAKALGGAIIWFPWVALNTDYRFSQQIDLSGWKGKITFRGPGVEGDTAVLVKLYWMGTGTTPAFKLSSTRGIRFEGLFIQAASASFTGWLIDAQKTPGGSDTAYLGISDCTIGGAYATAAALVCLNGAHDVAFDRVQFYSAQVGVLGKLTQGIDPTGGFAISVQFNSCSFALFTTSAIRNADESWDINAVFEPSPTGGASAYSHAPGILGRGVMFRNCWMGDVVAGQTGAWINYGGTALSIIGGMIANNTGGSMVTFDENNCRGFAVIGTALVGEGGYGISWGATTGASNVVILGVDWAGSWITALNNIPAGSLYTTPSNATPQFSALSVPGTLTAGNFVSAGGLTTASAALGINVGANLLTANQASFESGVTGWTPNYNCTVAQVTTQALDGTHSLRITATAAQVDTSVTLPVISRVTTGVTVGLTYTAFASVYAATTARNISADIYFYNSSDTLLVTIGGAVISAALNAWTQTPAISLVAPAGATKVAMTVRILNAAASEIFFLDNAQIAQGTSTTWAPGGVSVAPQHNFTATGLGFFGATPAVKPAATTEIKAALATFGLLTDGGASPLDLDGGQLSAGALKVTEGANAKQGTATLVAGTVTVANTSVTANSRIYLTAQSLGTVTAPQALAVTARTAATSFTIRSAGATDTSVIAYEIFEPA